MATSKITAAFILHALNLNDDFEYTIQENATATTLTDVQNTRTQLEYDHPDGFCTKREKNSILLFNTKANMFSIVAYPVAWHIHTFWDGKRSIENKILFKIQSYNWKKGVGRGGSPRNEFVFAILDWTQKSS